MKNEEAYKAFEPLKEKMDADNDVYLLVHFSRSEDTYKGYQSDKMDGGDALIVVQHLIEHFKLNPQVIANIHQLEN